MSQPKLRRAGQSLPWRLALGLFEFAASLKLAVILIFGMAFVLGLATFVEARYGTPTVQWSMYQTWWFDLLNLALAINIFAAAAIRYPWKRHQTGFVITHIGLLTLLFGCWMQRTGGIDAQIPILEDGSNRFFYEDDLSFAFEVTPTAASLAGSSESVATTSEPTEFQVPFRGGPFNWSVYPKLSPSDAAARQDWLAALANLSFQNAPRNVGPLPDPKLAAEGISLEVLDYWSNSQAVEAPNLKLEISTPQPKPGSRATEAEKARFGELQWMPIDLAVQPSERKPPAGEVDLGEADRQSMGGGAVVFWLTGTDDEVRSFLAGPDLAELGLGPQGQIVLLAGGKPYRLRVDQHVGKGKTPLGDSGVEVEIIRHYENAMVDDVDPATSELFLREAPKADDASGHGPAVELMLYGPEGKKQRIVRLTDHPEESRGKAPFGVYVSYWVDRSQKSSAEAFAGRTGSRLDVIQGPDLKLYYRRYGRRTTLPPIGAPADQPATVSMLFEAAPLPDDGEARTAFEMPQFESKMRLLPGGFIPRKTPGVERIPGNFDKKLDPSGAERMVKVRLKIGDKVNEEFWLRSQGLVDDQQVQAVQSRNGRPVNGETIYLSDQKKVVSLPDRTIEITLPSQRIEIGYNIKLDHVEQELDPGTNQPSHYGSQLDLIPPSGAKVPEVKDVRIVMNAPKDFTDPTTGRSYRLFQEGINGPVESADGKKRYFTVLTVNYDPGRGVKYVGCLLIIAGIATMFYMKAYFFKPAAKKSVAAGRDRGAVPATNPSTSPSEPESGGKSLAGAGGSRRS